MPGPAASLTVSRTAIRRLVEEEKYQADTRKLIDDISDGDVLNRCRQLNAFLKKVLPVFSCNIELRESGPTGGTLTIPGSNVFDLWRDYH
jgi:hypothetical protein